jgi:aryl-alcohol dehydrogenase-like predicted oxidoreductase
LKTMEHRTLGRSGCAVSTLALGTMTFGSEPEEAASHEQLDAFVDAGGTLIDTADAYSEGASEEIIGRWLARQPADVHSQRTWDVIDAVQSVALARGVSMAQVAIAWLVDRPMVSSVILGARTLEQLQDNLGATGLRLSQDETARLDAASDPAPPDYPYGAAGTEQHTRELAGSGAA